MISPSTIDEIRSRMDIVEVVSDYVFLKRAGANYKALSPFTQEKTPSFVVSPSKQIYKCFSTGKGGDAIGFVMEIDGLSYVEALRHLAKKYNVEIQEEKNTDEEQLKQTERESLYIILNFAKEYFKKLLWEDEEGLAIGMAYYKERGFSEETIKTFELGYSLDKWDGLIEAAKKNSYNEELLEKAGLKIVKDNKAYDRFRGRVVFPIHNVSGKTIAFGARVLKNTENQPKYINSPETELYTKSKIVYGIFQAKQSIRLEDMCYLVEGYTDVISMHQCGIKNVVASSGTSLTDDQIKLVARYTSNITVLFDGDAAGIKASLRGIDMLLECGLNVRAVRFPAGEDPDSYSQKLSPSAYKHFLDQEAVDFIVFKTSLLAADSHKDPVKKAETIRDIVISIAKIPDPIKRTVYIKECSSLLQIDESILITEQNKILIREGKNKRGKVEQEIVEEIAKDVGYTPEQARLPLEEALEVQERECIRMLLNYADYTFDGEEGNAIQFLPYFMQEFEDISFETEVYRQIFEMFQTNLAEGRLINGQYLIASTEGALKDTIIDIMAEKYELSEQWFSKFKIYVSKETDTLKKATYTGILRLKFRIVQKMIKANMEKLIEATDDAQSSEILEHHQQLKAIEVQIAKELGNVAVR